LKPCAHCGGTARRWKGIGEDCHVECGDCLARTSWDHKTKVVAAWNRRVVPAQQWTTEPPTEEGYYFVDIAGEEDISVVWIYRDKDVENDCLNVSDPSLLKSDWTLQDYCNTIVGNPTLLWRKIDTPKLPTQEDAK